MYQVWAYNEALEKWWAMYDPTETKEESQKLVDGWLDRSRRSATPPHAYIRGEPLPLQYEIREVI